MEQGVQRVWGYSFCSSLRIPNNVVKPFSTSGIWFFQNVLYILFLGFDALWGNCPSKKINFSGTKMTFVHRQFKACFLDAFESCSQVSDEMISIIGCDTDVVYILGALVRFNDFVKVFPRKAGECGQCPAKALCQSQICKCATCEVEG